jgi:hypothetical protein
MNCFLTEAGTITALREQSLEALLETILTKKVYFNDLRISSSASESKEDWKILPL